MKLHFKNPKPNGKLILPVVGKVEIKDNSFEGKEEMIEILKGHPYEVYSEEEKEDVEEAEKGIQDMTKKELLTFMEDAGFEVDEDIKKKKVADLKDYVSDLIK